MKSLVEMVEEFIEALFVGDVITGVHDKDYVIIMRSGNIDFVSSELERMFNLTNGLIPSFLDAKGEEQREAAARVIFNQVLILRNTGFLMNNPNSIKEVGFYRARALYFEDRNKELTETVMALKAGQSAVR